MKPEKGILCLINFLLGACFAFAVLVFLERLFRAGWPWYSRALLCWPILLCFPLGLLGRALPKLRITLLPLSCALALALMLLLGQFSALELFFRLIAAALAAALYLLGLRADEPFPGKLAVATLLVNLVVCLSQREAPELGVFCWFSLLSLLLSIYSFNAASLYEGVHNVKGGETMAIPAGIRVRNLLLLSGFLLLCLLLGSLGFLRNGLQSVWQFIWGGVVVVLHWLGAFATSSGLPSSTPSPTPFEPKETFDLSAVMEDGSGAFATVYGVILCLMCLAFLILAYGFGREKGGGSLRRLSGALRKLFRTKQVLEYEDDVEQISDLKTRMRERRKRLRSIWKKAASRPKSFGDMPDDRSRVKYVYRALLRSRQGESWTPATTPGELGASQESAVLRQLTDNYNQVRYDPESSIPSAFGTEAAEALRELRGR